MAGELRTYVIAQVPGWTLAAVAAGILYRWGLILGWLAFTLFALWVAKDLVLFPFMRRYYMPDPPERRMVGLCGVALTEIAPHGVVRIRGELWQAESERPIAEGARVRVLNVDGLHLRVDADTVT